MTENEASQRLPENPKCPQCGTPLPAGVLAELCPACLLKQGALADSATRPEGSPFVPPSVAEIAQLFPQLEIITFIGKGGMGAVYQARQKQLDRIVALKILPPGSGSDPAFAERFAREAKALARLNHPGIVTLYEFGSQPSADNSPPLYYFLMEFVDGVNLRQLLQTGRVSPREALAIVPQICDALQFAHDQGIVHRDIKPENILLDRRGRVKVADFGLAKLVGTGNEPATGDALSAGSPALTDGGKILGTPRYMAPEQVENPADVDHRADIYALGVVFYQMLTGELPDQHLEPPSHKVHIDVRLDEIVLRALEKKPERRYQQASALKTRIETIAAAPALTASSHSPVAPSSGRDYRTKQTIFGIPWVHVAWGTDPATGKPRVARGVVAVGTVAKGIVACGLEAYGVIATGLLAVGIAPVGLVALGFFTSGILGVGIQAVGLLAIGVSATGLVAIGLDTVGILSAGRHAVGSLKPKWAPGILFAAIAAGCLAMPFFRGMIHSAISPPGTTTARRPAKTAFLGASLCAASFLLLVLIWGGIKARTPTPQYGVWSGQPMDWTDDAGALAAVLRVTDATQNGRIAILKIVDEAGLAPHDLTVEFQGAVAELLPSLADTNLAGLLAPSPQGPATLVGGTNVVRGPGEFQFGFVFPDEASAETAVNDIAQSVAFNRAQNLSQGHSFMLFDLTREMQASGKSDWREELQAAITVSSGAGKPSALRFRLVARDDDTNSLGDVMSLDSGKFSSSIRVLRDLVLDGSEVARAGLEQGINGTQNIDVELTPEGRRRFSQFTAANVGRQLAIVFQGKLLTAPIIRSAIDSPTVVISGRFESKEIDRILDTLNPATGASRNLHFGPEEFCTMPLPARSSRTFLELGSNRWSTNNAWDNKSREFHEWLRQNHADLTADGATVSLGKILNLSTVLHIYNAPVTEANTNAWETATPIEVWFDWNLMSAEPPTDTQISLSKTNSGAFFFRTRDDARGVLQILGVSDNPPGVKIRYKLVQPADLAEAKSQVKDNQLQAERQFNLRRARLNRDIDSATLEGDLLELARLNLELAQLQASRAEDLYATGKMSPGQIEGFREANIRAKLEYRRALEANDDDISAVSVSTNELKPVPTEAVARFSELKGLSETPAYKGKLHDPEVRQAFSQELEVRSQQIRTLLQGTVAQPLISEQQTDMKELSSALASNDTNRIQELQTRIKNLGVQIEQLLKQSTNHVSR